MTPDYEKRTGRCAKCNARLNPDGKCPYRKWLDHQPGKVKKTQVSWVLTIPASAIGGCVFAGGSGLRSPI